MGIPDANYTNNKTIKTVGNMLYLYLEYYQKGNKILQQPLPELESLRSNKK